MLVYYDVTTECRDITCRGVACRRLACGGVGYTEFACDVRAVGMQTEVGGSVDVHACVGMQMRCEPAQIRIKKKNSYLGVMDACAGVRVEG